jgi:hypothetical protein
MTTWGEMFGLVLRDAGVAGQGQTPNAQMAADAKMRCQFMIDGWKRKRWLVYHLIDLSTPCDGSLFYTLGSGQTFDVPRTDQIDAAFARQVNPAAQPNQPDFPLRIIKSYEDYSRITLKQLHAGPAYALFYDSGYPVGKVYAWPLMSNQYDLHIIIKGDLANVGNLTDDIVFPPEYNEAIYYNSLQRARIAFQLPSDPDVNRLAKTSLQTLRGANFQVANLKMPAAVQPIRGSGYNIWSDTTGPQGG